MQSDSWVAPRKSVLEAEGSVSKAVRKLAVREPGRFGRKKLMASDIRVDNRTTVERRGRAPSLASEHTWKAGSESLVAICLSDSIQTQPLLKLFGNPSYSKHSVFMPILAT